MRASWLLLCLLLAGCGSVTLPAAVQMPDGSVMVGTTTAAMSGGSFSVSAPDGSRTCDGAYDPFDTTLTISIPVQCSDGLQGNILITRDPSGRSGRGIVHLSDGGIATVAFGNQSGSLVSQEAPSAGISATSNLESTPIYFPRAQAAPVRHSDRSSARGCCRVCRTGKPCGNSCIARNKTCRTFGGCAC